MKTISTRRLDIRNQIKIIHITVLIVLVLTLIIPPSSVQAAACSCVTYVKNRYALSGTAGNATNMGPFLRDRGFVRISYPKVSAVVIFKSTWGLGSAGHVGVITRVVDAGSNWRITVRGANQQNWGLSSEYNCDNVATTQYREFPKSWGTTYIEYWTRNFALGRSTRSTSNESAYYDKKYGNDGSTLTRWSSAHTNFTKEWYIIDLGTTRTFDRVRINWEAAYATYFFVGYSNDGTTFRGIYRSNSSTGNRVYYFSGLRTARYVGIQMITRRSGMANFSFWEVAVFANGLPAD